MKFVREVYYVRDWEKTNIAYYTSEAKARRKLEEIAYSNWSNEKVYHWAIHIEGTAYLYFWHELQ